MNASHLDGLPLPLARQLDKLCDRFDAAWRAAAGAGERPRLEPYVAEVSEPERATAVRELLAIDIEYRRQAGESPHPGDYQERFPMLDRGWLAEVCGTSSTPLPAPDGLAAAPVFAARQRVGKFQLLKRVGGGAFGAVWQAHDTELNRIVALKVPHAGLLEMPEYRERFQREARAAAQLRHPGIVTVFEVATLDGQPVLVSDFIEGRPLRDLIREKRWPYREAAALVAKVAEALDYAHGMGVIHRDVKPANILLERTATAEDAEDTDKQTKEDPASGTPRAGNAGATLPSSSAAFSASSAVNRFSPRLADFGLALCEGAGATLTQEGQLIGTPAYMSPEQAAGHGHQVDRRSDVYSLGVVLYELLTGRLPFDGSKETILQKVLHEEPRRPRQVDGQVPPDLETVCLKALAKEPARRYPTARALADDLRRWLDGEPIKARQVGTWERAWRWVKRRPAAAALILVSAVAVLAVGGVIAGLFYNARLEQAVERAETFRYFHHIAVADAAWHNNNLGRTLSLLEQCPEHRRGWEWHYLQRLCQADLFTLRGHEGEVASIAFSPDGTRIASGGHDRKVRIWDAAAGQLLHKLDAHSDLVNAVAFSPDGNWLASASPEGTLKVWNWKTKDEPLCLPTHKGWAQCVAFSPDGTVLAAGGAKGTVQVWTLAAPQKPRTLTGHSGLVIGLAFSPDGRRLASASMDGTVILWDVRAGRQERPPLKGHASWVHAVAFNPEGTRLVSAGRDQTVRIWDAATGQQLHEMVGHTAAVTSVAFSPDGTRLASVGRDQTVRIWDAAAGKLVSTLRGHTGWVQRVAFSPDGSRLASASSDGTVKVWSVLTEAECRTLKGHTDHVFAVAFSPDGGLLASVSGDDSVRVWDMTTGRAVRTLPHQVADIPSMAYSPDGSRLAAPRKDKAVIVWDARSGKEIHTLRGHARPVWTVAFSPDSAWLASSDVDGQVRLWDVATGQEVRPPFPALPPESLDREVPPTLGRPGVAFNPRGTALAVGGRDGSLRVWNLQTGEETFQVPDAHTRNSRCVTFSPDGNRLASGGWDEKIRIWDAAAGKLISTLQGHTGPVNSLAYSPDGSRLASVGGDHVLRIWDVATGQELLRLRGDVGLAFSPDGFQLATTTADNTVKIWDARPLSPEQRIEREAVSVLDFLLAGPLDKAAVHAHLHSTRTISSAVRQRALALLEQCPEETWQAGRKE